MQYDTDSWLNNMASSNELTSDISADTSLLKVFLIEDSLLLQEMLGDMLSELDGVEFCGAAEGETEALSRLAEAPVDLVIIDIELKQGSGIGVLDALQTDSEQYGRPLKAVLTNYAHTTMRQRCDRFGMDAFFDKSMQINQLIDYVNEAADLKRAAS